MDRGILSWLALLAKKEKPYLGVNFKLRLYQSFSLQHIKSATVTEGLIGINHERSNLQKYEITWQVSKATHRTALDVGLISPNTRLLIDRKSTNSLFFSPFPKGNDTG